jgi:dTDP-4-amino-4,6-dideoxygalactose transaminase
MKLLKKLEMVKKLRGNIKKQSIPYGRQYIDNYDIRSVSNALKQNLITTGDYVKKFENKISKFFDVKFSASCSSGTSAIHLAFMAIGVEKGDVIIMPAINFIAAYNMAKFMNASVFLADVDPFTGQMTPKTLLDIIKRNKLKKIKVILTMYLGGYPEHVLEFYNIKKKFNCYLIEDACHALGARYLFNKKYLSIGSCKHSDISTFSLHPVKTITTGEGGLITTNNRIIYNKIIHLRSHGIYRDKKFHWKYNVKNISFNYRLSDLNCALGISQLEKIEKFISYRKKIFNVYKTMLKKYRKFINFPSYCNTNKSSYHLFLISLDFKKISSTKDKLLEFFKKNNVLCQYHYIPIYKFKLFDKKINLNFYKGSEIYYQNTLSLPIFYNLSINSVKEVVKKMLVFLKI